MFLEYNPVLHFSVTPEPISLGLQLHPRPFEVSLKRLHILSEVAVATDESQLLLFHRKRKAPRPLIFSLFVLFLVQGEQSLCLHHFLKSVVKRTGSMPCFKSATHNSSVHWPLPILGQRPAGQALNVEF